MKKLRASTIQHRIALMRSERGENPSVASDSLAREIELKKRRSPAAPLIAPLVASLLSAGCVIIPEEREDVDLYMVRVTQPQADGLQNAGREFIYQGYAENGVIVTPARNWYYGQSDSFPGGGSMIVGSRADMVAAATIQSGGMPTGADAERMGTRRTTDETNAISRLGLIGKYARQENLGPFYRPHRSGIARGTYEMFEIEEVLRSIGALNPAQVPVISLPTLSLDTPVPQVNFDSGKYDLSPGDRSDLTMFGQMLRDKSNLVVVGGFTDNVAGPDINTPLSLARSKVTADAIRGSGASDEALVLYRKPLCCYIAPNITASGRAENRRSEIRLGGFYTRADALNYDEVAKAIAIIMKTVDGDANAPLRVYGVGPSEVAARFIAEKTKAMLVSPDIGMTRVDIGELAHGPTLELVFEVSGNLGVTNE